MEVPYMPWMIEKKKFELIYLEHVNYLMVRSILYLCKITNLYIEQIKFAFYHGRMIRVVISKIKSKNNFERILLRERNHFRKLIKIKEFTKNIYKRKINFLAKIKKLKVNPKCKIVAIGASAKTNSLLNFFNLNHKYINFITDNSKEKIGKYIINKKIPIKTDRSIKYHRNIYVFFPTWNISDFMKKKLIKINKNINFIKY